MADLPTLAISGAALLIAFLSWLDKRSQHESRNIQTDLEEIREELRDLRTDFYELSISQKILEERTNNEIKHTGTLFEKLEKKLDDIERQL